MPNFRCGALEGERPKTRTRRPEYDDPRGTLVYVGRVAVIETVGLTKQYPSVTALDHLDVTVGDGVTGLVGANGAGKSTLIKLLLGLVPATEGTATVLGHDIATRRCGDPRVGRLHARARLPAGRRLGQRLRGAHGPDVGAALQRVSRAGGRRAAPRRAGRGAVPADGRLLDRHEAAGQAGAGARARPAAGAARRADQRARPVLPRRHARAGAQGRARVRHRGAGDLAPARRARAGQRPRGRAGRRQAAAVLGHHRLPARHRQPGRRGDGQARRRPAAGPGPGRGGAHRSARRRAR